MLQEYKLLKPEDPNLEEEQCSKWRSTTVDSPVKLFVPLLIFLLFASLALNVMLGYQQLQTQRECSRESPTKYGRALIAFLNSHRKPLKKCIAGLSRDVSIPFTIDDIYDSKNRSIADEAWGSPLLMPETGLVAISDDWVTSKGLPKAQRFPWDKSKGLYMLNGFHNIHCLVSPYSLCILVFLLTHVP